MFCSHHHSIIKSVAQQQLLADSKVRKWFYEAMETLNGDLHAPLNEKKSIFRTEYWTELKCVQRELKPMVKWSKDSHSRRLEEKLLRNKAMDIWTGLS